jgi:hypothetical protein
VDCGLLIAAGGGGDAIAAAILHHALDDHTGRAAIATYSWDRLLIDPLPGPRDPSSFTRLQPVGELNYRVTRDTAPIPPAGSTLPRLAAELEADLYLLDPRRGAEGLAEQLAELRDQLNAAAVTIVDVGGDILAHGDEPTLRSPIADSLALAAAAHFGAARLLVSGPGIDGELPENIVLERYEQLGARLVHQLTAHDVERFRPLFDWHPSEATGLLCAAASGTRGTAEIRDHGFPVELTDHTPNVHLLTSSHALASNHIARDLDGTKSLADVENAIRATGRTSEIDYERRKAADGHAARRGVPTPGAVGSRAFADELAHIREDAARRGTDFITLRGLAERLGIPGTGLADLQNELKSAQQLGEYSAPLWNMRP